MFEGPDIELNTRILKKDTDMCHNYACSLYSTCPASMACDAYVLRCVVLQSVQLCHCFCSLLR